LSNNFWATESLPIYDLTARLGSDSDAVKLKATPLEKAPGALEQKPLSLFTPKARLWQGF
jgi:hypothetical protein